MKALTRKLSEAALHKILIGGSLGIISAGKNPATEAWLTDEAESLRHASLGMQLQLNGLYHMPVIGKYNNLEKSYVVWGDNCTEETLVRLGREYNQESVILCEDGLNRLIYCSGSKVGMQNLGRGFEQVAEDAEDFYTECKDSSGCTYRFILEFDFNLLLPIPEREVQA